MIVIFTEEKSMKATLEELIGRFFPHSKEGTNWFCIPFNGKSDLETNFPLKMKRWPGRPFFIILRDNDSGDCQKRKSHLTQLALPTQKNFKVRIVCQELESWFLGDAQAVKAAYPQSENFAEKAKYRNPDNPRIKPSEELANITGNSLKVSRASSIARHMDPETNTSASFRVFFKTLRAHLEDSQPELDLRHT
jgi:hypothetical protein